ncbi:CGNR zinc finger domain-containing protein [Streptomyces sp. NPDC005551]|uniref:CGNR zinc finger domain-containing protein n=1 Tax=Streptomyces sp. NPDC005551 TaxID=3364725 RepID=UPI0036845F2F
MASGTATASYEMRFDSGRICLDLVATTHPGERLCSAERLRAWIAGSGLVPAGTPLAAVDEAWLAACRELRADIERLVGAELDGRPADAALARVNARAEHPPPVPRAVRAEDGTLLRRLRGPLLRAGVLSALSRDALELLTDPAARAGLRRCEGDNCRIVYLDTSRGRRRRWCSSEVCGNRERVARHRRRAALART